MQESTILEVHHFLRSFNIVDLAVQSEEDYFSKEQFDVKGKINVSLSRPAKLDNETCELIATFQIEFADVKTDKNTYLVVSIEHNVVVKFDPNELNEQILYDKRADASHPYHRKFGDIVIDKLWEITRDLGNVVLHSTRYEDVILPDSLRDPKTVQKESR